jgi:hypothetical protein
MTPSLVQSVAIAITIIVLTACRDDGGTVSPPAPVFELDCDSSDTATASHLFCVRTDTRNGEILRVNPQQLPTTSGSTAVAPGRHGRFTTVCDATATDTHSDFYCIRLNTETGDMVLVNLQKIDLVPAGK